MSFWRTFGFHTISPIESILDRENFTLEDLLDEVCSGIVLFSD
jgi:hypothetical protein